MRALLIRERMEDIYDPDKRFKWIVEMDQQVSAYHAVRRWREQQHGEEFSDYGRYMMHGRMVAFVDRDDALLFYLKYA